MKSLDRIDADILDALQRDGRIANVALAKQVGLSPTPCNERVKALEADGFIKGYAARIDPARVGLGLLTFVTVSLDNTSQAAFDAFSKAVTAIPEIQECHMVAGGFDYVLKVRVSDMAAYRAFLGNVLSTIPGIRETHTYPVMEEVKESHDVDLAALRHRVSP